jgi:exocyst complex component 4
MLDTLPHDQAFSQLIITQIVTYYDKCYGWYKATMSRTQAHPQTGKRMKMSAALLESGDINTIVEELRTSNIAKRQGIIAKEHANLLNSLEGALVEDQDLILDKRNLAGLCLLLTSMKWFAVKIQSLRFISSQNEDSSQRNSERYDKQRRWTLITAQQEDDPDQVYLPLTEETASAFDGVHNSYLLLSSSVLRALHVEMRMHIVHFISRSMRRTFQLDQELNEADPEIVALNTDLAGFDEELATHLQDDQQS